MKNLRLKDHAVLLGLIGAFAVLHFLFDLPWKYLGGILLTGILAAFALLLIRTTVYSYIHPSDWVFEHRAHVEGFIQGIMLFIIMIGAHLGDHSYLNLGSLVIAFMVSMIIGIIFLGRFYSKKIKKFDDFNLPEYGNLLFSEKAKYQTEDEEPIPGLLFLTDSRLIFWSANKHLQGPSGAAAFGTSSRA